MYCTLLIGTDDLLSAASVLLKASMVCLLRPRFSSLTSAAKGWLPSTSGTTSETSAKLFTQKGFPERQQERPEGSLQKDIASTIWNGLCKEDCLLIYLLGIFFNLAGL